MMRALVRNAGTVRLVDVERPVVAGPNDVVVDVACAGLCRTDVYVAEGRIPVAEPRVLGHELSGVVRAVGPGVEHVGAGDRVAVMPIVGCGTCAECDAGRGTRCTSSWMVGVDRDGAFADALVVPARAVHPIPDRLSHRHAAYAEPLAASLAVLDAGLARDGRGLILGGNRIAELTRRVLRADHHRDVRSWDAADGPTADGAFDWVIETQATDATLSIALSAVRPGGTVVLKSRPARPVALDVAAAVRREVTLRAVQYGSFTEALQWLAAGFEVDDLLGDTWPLEAFDRVLARAHLETKKVFFGIDGGL